MTITPFGWTQATSTPAKTVSPFTDQYLRAQSMARKDALPDFKMDNGIKQFYDAARNQYMDNMRPQEGWMTQPGAKQSASNAFANQYKPVGGLWPQVPQGLMSLASQGLMNHGGNLAKRYGIQPWQAAPIAQNYTNQYMQGAMNGQRMGDFDINNIFRR